MVWASGVWGSRLRGPGSGVCLSLALDLGPGFLSMSWLAQVIWCSLVRAWHFPDFQCRGLSIQGSSVLGFVHARPCPYQASSTPGLVCFGLWVCSTGRLSASRPFWDWVPLGRCLGKSRFVFRFMEFGEQLFLVCDIRCLYYACLVIDGRQMRLDERSDGNNK